MFCCLFPPSDEVTMEEVGQTTQLRAGELIIIVVVLIMWAGEDKLFFSFLINPGSSRLYCFCINIAENHKQKLSNLSFQA